MALLGKFFLWLMGWKVVGQKPALKKYLAIVYPHTAASDFFVAMATRFATRTPINWMGKHTIFVGPIGWLLRAIGGVPIDRRTAHDTVSQIVSEYQKREQFMLALAPEGTRGPVDYLKSGFYHMALEAKVPLSLAFLDFERKEAGFGPVIELTGNVSEDMDKIRAFYKTKRGKNPECEGRIRLREEDDVSAGS